MRCRRMLLLADKASMQRCNKQQSALGERVVRGTVMFETWHETRAPRSSFASEKARVKSVACRRIKRSHRNFVAKPCSEACLACPSSSSGSRQMRNLPVPSKSVQASQCRGACTHQPNSPIAVTRAHPRPAPSAGTPRPHSGGTPPAGRPLPPRSTPETPGVVKADVTLPVLWPSAPAGAGQRA